MCGRYTYYSSEEILKQFDLMPTESLQQGLHFPDNYNVSPGQDMPVIVRGSQQHVLDYMIWGLIPAWSKSPHTTLKLINARQEGLLAKPMWKRLVKSKRCIIPAKGFYEWKKVDGKKLPYYITPVTGSVLSFAGLWDSWRDATGSEMLTFTIITTSPNKEMKQIHDRMPAILNKQQSDMWLEPIDLSRSQLDDLLKPAPDGSLTVTRVSTNVNNARHNNAELIYPLSD